MVLRPCKSITLQSMFSERAAHGAALLGDPKGDLIHGKCSFDPKQNKWVVEAGILAQLVASGQSDRIILCYADPAKAKGRFVQWPLIRWSNHPDPLVRAHLNELFLEHFIALGFTTQQIKDGTLSPLKYKYAKAGGAVIQGLPTVPAKEMLHLMNPRSDMWRWLLDNTTNQQAADEFRLAAANAKGKPSFYYSEVGSSLRMYDFLGLTPVWTHDGTSLDWKQVILDQKIVLLDLSGVSVAACRTLFMSAYTNAIHACKELFDESNQIPHALHVAGDEVGRYGWVTPFMVTSIQEGRAWGFSWDGATQTIEDIQPPELREQLFGLVDMYFHHMSSGLERSAQAIADVKFKADAVLDTHERQINAGMKEVRFKTSSENENETILAGPGHKKNKGKSRSTKEHVSFQADFKTIVDKVFKTPQVQLSEIKAELSSLAVGQFYFKGFSGASIQTTQMPAPAWVLEDEFLPSLGMTLYEARMAEAVERIRSDPKLYSPPREWQIPSNNGETISLPTSKPGPTPKVQTPKGGNGMRGS